MVRLVNLYLQLDSALYDELLCTNDNIFYVFYPQEKKMLLTSTTHHFFAQIHKCQSTFLKTRDAKGTKAFQIAGILIDNALDTRDRELPFQVSDNEGVKIITVLL